MNREMISSRQNRYVRQIISLRKKKERDASRLIWVEGERGVSSLPEGTDVLFYVTTDPERASSYPSAICVTEDIFSYISDVSAPQGIGAVCAMPEDGAVTEDMRHIVYLDRVQNPDNVGAIVRSAACAGFDAVITGPGSADIWSPKALRASAACVFMTKMIRGSLEDVKALRDKGYSVIGSHLSGSEDADISAPERSVLIIGNEGSGMSDEASGLCDCLVRIPMRDGCESLNAACAATLLMYRIKGIFR